MRIKKYINDVVQTYPGQGTKIKICEVKFYIRPLLNKDRSPNK